MRCVNSLANSESAPRSPCDPAACPTLHREQPTADSGPRFAVARTATSIARVPIMHVDDSIFPTSPADVVGRVRALLATLLLAPRPCHRILFCIAPAAGGGSNGG
jgi:hypothetical protein